MFATPFTSRERALLIIGFLTFVFVVLCFGALESTGSIDDDQRGIAIGGALVGFVVIFELLSRFWLKTGSRGTGLEADGGGFFYDEVVKVVDFRVGGDDARITDYYRISAAAEATHVRYHYATNGDAVRGDSLTHETSGLQETDGHHMKRNYVMTVDLQQGGLKGPRTLVNEFDFLGGFRRRGADLVETHVDKPTARLTFVLVFEPGQTGMNVRALKEKRDPEEIRHLPPVTVADQSIVFWSIEEPDDGAAYRLTWEWPLG